MALTPFFVASFNGQTANADLTAYSPQSGDLNAAFTKAGYVSPEDAAAGGVRFHSTRGALKEISTKSGVSDYTYLVNTQPSQIENDIRVDFVFGPAPVSGVTLVHGVTIGDSNSNNRLNAYLAHGSGETSLTLQNIVGGTETTPGAPAVVPYAANGSYTMIVQIRGSAGSLTATALWGPTGGGMTTVFDKVAIPNLTIPGRSIGIRMASVGANNQETNGVFIDGASASAYTVDGTTPPTPTPADPDFSISSTPASMALAQGRSLTTRINGQVVGGFSSNVALTVENLPTGVSASFSAATLTGGAGDSTLTLTAAGNAITGASEIIVKGVGGGKTRTTPILLQVEPPRGAVYPVVTNVLSTDLVTITRNGTTEQVSAAGLKAFLAS
jgi:hypothetical protein